MKKALLILGAGIGISATAQTITVDDTLSSGMSTTYYVLDSNAVNLAAVIGTGVTWDYSSILGYSPSMTNTDNVTNAASSTYASDYPNSDYNDDLSTGASLYFTNNPDSMTVQGFAFALDVYTVKVFHSANPMIALKFPMSVGDTYNDVTQGTVDVVGIPIVGTASGTTTGNVVVTCDGFGTLNVGSNTHTNVLRIKLVENIATTITVPPFGPSAGTVTRTLYSYYDLANDKQAIFVHATIDVATDIASDNYTAVYYSGAPSGYLGVEEEKSKVEFSVYPNPAANVVNITTDGTAQSLKVINSIGQVVYSIQNPNTNVEISVSDFPAGVYIVQINTNDVLTEQKLVVE